LDEWSTGVHDPVAFTEQEYKEPFKQHLEMLKKFKADTRAEKILPLLQALIFKHSW
jgi:hypothetical protein